MSLFSSVRTAHFCVFLQAFMLCFTVCFLAPATVQGAVSFHPGFKTLGLWQESSSLRVDLNVWYPSIRRASEVTYAPWSLLVARNGREVEGRFPLLLLSHDSVGSRFSHHETAAMLARSGFVVAALTHSNDNANNMPHLFSLQQITDRVAQLTSTLDMLLTHPEISPSIDPERIGIMGFGTGATAALLLGGALPTGAQWQDYCTKAGSQDPYCSSWAQPRMQKFTQSLPLKKSLADTRIKVVAAVAPAYGMLFTKESLQYFYPSLLLIRADRDEINRAPLHADALRGLFPKVPKFVSIADVDAAALMSACPPALQKDIPELCGRANSTLRRKGHKQLNSELAQFFLSTLGDMKDLPHIPQPPDLTPPPPPVRAVPEKAAPEKKKGRKSEPKGRQQQR